MSNPGNKKKSPVIFFLICLAVAFAITIIVNSQSTLVKELRIPLNNGIAKLSTYGNMLAAFSLDNKAYIFDWTDLSKKYQTIDIKSDQTALLKDGTIVSVPKYNSKSVSIIKAAGNTREIEVNGEDKKAFLDSTQNGDEAVLTLAQSRTGEPNQTNLTFYLIDPNKDSAQILFTTDLQINISQRLSIALSEGGGMIGLSGTKNGQAWIAVCSIKEKKVVWEKELPEPALFFNCVFSPDSKTIFARGSDTAVYKFGTESGQLEGSLSPLKENTSMLKDQNIQITQISSDGNLIGSVVSWQVTVWDTKNGKKIFSKWLSHKLVAGIAFSPDSKFIATADMRQGGKIKIWKLPKH
jgi:WD40 repeat protein